MAFRDSRRNLREIDSGMGLPCACPCFDKTRTQCSAGQAHASISIRTIYPRFTQGYLDNVAPTTECPSSTDTGKTAPLLTNSTDRPFHRPGAPNLLVSPFLKKRPKTQIPPNSGDLTTYFPTKPDPQKTPPPRPQKLSPYPHGEGLLARALPESP